MASLTLTATDLAGNTTEVTVPITLEAAPPPDPTATKQPLLLSFFPTRTPTATPTATPTSTPPAPTRISSPQGTPAPTRTQSVLVFAAPTETAVPAVIPVSSAGGTSPGANILWGAAAAGAIGAATAYALVVRRKRKEEEARARAEAEQANKDARAREKGYDTQPMEEFFQMLGYSTSATAFGDAARSVAPNGNGGYTVTYKDEHTETVNGIIIGVNIDTNPGKGGVLTQLEQPAKGEPRNGIVGHWVTLLEYNPDTKIARIYNPYMNQIEVYEGEVKGEGDNGSWQDFMDAWWGDALQADNGG